MFLLAVIYIISSVPGSTAVVDKEYQTLLSVNGPSDVYISDLWTLNGVAVANASCYRNTLIDDFGTRTPNWIRIFFHDINHHILWSMIFLIPNNYSSLSWVKTSNYHVSYNGAELQGNISFDTKNGRAFLSNDSSNSYIYVYQGIGFTTTRNVILITKDGYPYPLSAYNTVKTTRLFQQDSVTEVNGFDTLHIRFNESWMEYMPIMNGISIRTLENLNTTFTIEYTNYGGEICSKETVLVPYLDFEGVCNGSYIALSPIRPECLRIIFSENVTDVVYELYVTDDIFIESSRITLVAQYDKIVETTTEENIQACNCRSVYKSLYPNMTNDQIEEMLKDEIAQIKANLSVNTDILSSTIRKKSCAKDSRASSQVTGALAVVFIGLIFGVVFVSDIIKVVYILIKFVRKYL